MPFFFLLDSGELFYKKRLVQTGPLLTFNLNQCLTFVAYLRGCIIRVDAGLVFTIFSLFLSLMSVLTVQNTINR